MDTLGTTSRIMMLLFVLVIMVFTSHFQWMPEFASHLDTNPRVAQKLQQPVSKHEVENVKDKIILSQEKIIQRMNEFIRNLNEQLQHCMNQTCTVADHWTEDTLENEQQT